MIDPAAATERLAREYQRRGDGLVPVGEVGDEDGEVERGEREVEGGRSRGAGRPRRGSPRSGSGLDGLDEEAVARFATAGGATGKLQRMLTEPVQRAKTSPDGLERTPTGGIKVRLPLKPEPDDAWAACFVQPFSEHFTTSSIRGHGLTIVGGAVEYVTSETNFDAALSDVDRRIAGCNKWYFGDYTRRATQEQLAHEARGREAQAEQQRIGDKFGGK